MINIQEKFYKSYSSIMSSNKLDSDCKLILTVMIQLWINYKNINISNSKLSELLGIPDKTLRRKKKILQDLQLIKVIPSNSREKGFESNKYEIIENNINTYFNNNIFITKDKNNKETFSPTIGTYECPDKTNFN